MKPSEVILDIRIVLESPLPELEYGLQEGSGRSYQVLQRQRSEGRDLVFMGKVRAMIHGRHTPKFLGPIIQGPPLERFVYLDIGTYAGQSGSEWGRRLKIPLKGIDPDWIRMIVEDPSRCLETRVPGVGADGTPTCGTIKPFSGWRLVRN